MVECRTNAQQLNMDGTQVWRSKVTGVEGLELTPLIKLAQNLPFFI